MDLVYLYYPGRSRWGDREIVYSLRSVEMYLRGVGRVWVASPARPHQLVNIEWINCPDGYKNSHANTCLKVLLACLKPRVSDPFLVMNDDFFVVRETWAQDIPAYTLGDLWGEAARHGGRYSRRMVHTAEVLEARGRPTWSFEAHVPIPVRKEEFVRAVREYDWETDPVGFLWRSLYANEANIPGVPLDDDPKVFDTASEGQFRATLARHWCFSTSPHVNTPVAGFLLREFPYPSRYEAKPVLPNRIGL